MIQLYFLLTVIFFTFALMLGLIKVFAGLFRKRAEIEREWVSL
jgi:hypothetical protein